MAIMTRCCWLPDNWWVKPNGCRGQVFPLPQTAAHALAKPSPRRVCRRRSPPPAALPRSVPGWALMAFWKIIATRRPRTSCIFAGQSNRSWSPTITAPWGDMQRIGQQAHGGQRGHRFAAAGLTHQGEDLPRPQLQADSAEDLFTGSGPARPWRSCTCMRISPDRFHACDPRCCWGQTHRAPGPRTGWRRAPV